MTRRERRLAGARFLAGLLLLAGAACHGDTTGPTRQVALELEVAPEALTGRWLSTFAEARLAVRSTAGGADRVLTEPLDSVVTNVRFDLTLDPGRYLLDAEILSNNDVRLYAGSADAAIDEDGFTVTIDVEPVNAVILVQPGPPTVEGPHVAVPLTIRNAGIRDLRVTAGVDIDAAVFCSPTAGQNCSFSVPPGVTSSLTITVDDALASPGVDSFLLWLDSDVGRVSIDVAVP
jgi:hypothetical protein